MPQTPPKAPPEPRSAAEARRDRQAAALRDNLRKRKAQARDQRDAAERDPPPEDGAAS